MNIEIFIDNEIEPIKFKETPVQIVMNEQKKGGFSIVSDFDFMWLGCVREG